MVSVLLSILADFADSAKAFFSGYGLEALGLLALVVILKVGAEFFKNRYEVDWNSLHLVSQAKNLSQIMIMDWEPYSFLTRHLLTEQGYRIIGSSVNDLSGIDIVAEKSGKRTLFRFGRSTAETIYSQEIRDLLIKAQQFNASSAYIVTPGEVSSSAEHSMKDAPVTLVNKSELIEWFNKFAGAKLHSISQNGMDIGGIGLSSHSMSDNDLAA